MHIFVTGGAGYIGSICSEELINAGHQVTIFDNLSEGHRAAVDKRATFIKGDLMNREEIFAAVKGAKPDAMMHFAANSLVMRWGLRETLLLVLPVDLRLTAEALKGRSRRKPPDDPSVDSARSMTRRESCAPSERRTERNWTSGSLDF